MEKVIKRIDEIRGDILRVFKRRECISGVSIEVDVCFEELLIFLKIAKEVRVKIIVGEKTKVCIDRFNGYVYEYNYIYNCINKVIEIAEKKIKKSDINELIRHTKRLFNGCL